MRCHARAAGAVRRSRRALWDGAGPASGRQQALRGSGVWWSGSCDGRLPPLPCGARSRSIRRHPTYAGFCTTYCAGWGMTKKTRNNCARDWLGTPDSPSLLAALGHSLIAQGRLDEGLACCRAVLNVDPNHQDATDGAGSRQLPGGTLRCGLARSLSSGGRASTGARRARPETSGRGRTSPDNRSCSTASRDWAT